MPTGGLSAAKGLDPEGDVRMGTRTVFKPKFVSFEISNLRCPKSCSSFGRRGDMALPTPLPSEKPFLTWAPSYHPVNLRGLPFCSQITRFITLLCGWLQVKSEHNKTQTGECVTDRDDHGRFSI